MTKGDFDASEIFLLPQKPIFQGVDKELRIAQIRGL